MRYTLALVILGFGAFTLGWRSNSLVSQVANTQTFLATSTTQALYLVTRVVDGDTIVVSIDGTEQKVRLLGINTPETVDPRKTVECFGKQASEKTKSLLSGSSVRLEADASQGDRDTYGRLLRYVWRDDNLFINESLVSEGYAYEYTYRTPYKYQKEFKATQKDARMHNRGLWAPGACKK